jgi:lipid-binding SYLF domain-containing protein
LQYLESLYAPNGRVGHKVPPAADLHPGKTSSPPAAYTAAAGPGATAASASDVDILTYGRAKGVFAGVSLGGATVEPDNDPNYRLYGKTLTATDIVRGTNIKPSVDGQALVTVLDSKLTKHSK